MMARRLIVVKQRQQNKPKTKAATKTNKQNLGAKLGVQEYFFSPIVRIQQDVAVLRFACNTCRLPASRIYISFFFLFFFFFAIFTWVGMGWGCLLAQPFVFVSFIFVVCFVLSACSLSFVNCFVQDVYACLQSYHL